ncbi:RecQ family ATP-dependent DNA helicase [Flavilitoribacter nigricans]|uniref:ATP-binding protein n=1 Tax=Flavilitoribacter nigricans (strain ATCC 23147 / DSM 23189 / NBRC 102662 / NCIMB 1420 / SS-2) TaxID=1122177 RepID=A0A2D0NKE2_FLAN2|nr:RecQ family ATP-dependent DNA helicase [Flavilitoribacter nigricans]PHN08679.1 ATP-binding protein [Flavilitoribacter nigricans DSM 23189 = NBRC 102662]
MMPGISNILFFDLEVHKKSKNILEIGAVLRGDQFRKSAPNAFVQFSESAEIVCGHNIVDHDLPILEKYLPGHAILSKPVIDTLFLSALLYPKKPYHRLIKNYQLNGNELNNPLADAKLTRDLVSDLLQAYRELPPERKAIYFSLLGRQKGFNGFFKIANPNGLQPLLEVKQLAKLLQVQYSQLICGKSDLITIIDQNPVELAYTIALISTNDIDSLPPPWLLHRFPAVMQVINRLRLLCNANGNCPYCQFLQPKESLKRHFGFPGFRRFEGDGDKPLQEQVVEATLNGKSLIAIFPTGGGKSLTFQLPALMEGEANRSLTVVISPLQSLMKDQVDVLEKRHGITAAVTINGMLSPLERSESIERVQQGGANLLYISPESLRSTTIIKLLKGRQIARFVIDEAHCLSSWGQDFRVDYLYIGRFIKKLQQEKNLAHPIPVSCFTATAKPAVVKDILAYFKVHLALELEVFQTSAKRRNLKYYVISTNTEQEKQERLIELLQSEEGPKIVYVSRVKTAEKLAQNLQAKGFQAKAYHGKLESDAKKKIQEEFMDNENDLDVIVATSAFGMGVDKDNVKIVIHYQISDSLENYMQESGRAGRNPELRAKCFILFDEEDLSGHFQLLNKTKLNYKEINQIWYGIKRFKKKSFSKSALEIAKEAGWDVELYQLETRVKMAISALEESGYLSRGENTPSIFASSIVAKNVDQANQLIDTHADRFDGIQDTKNAKRVFKSVLSRARAQEDTRVDVMADALAVDKDEISRYLTIFRQIGILSHAKDLTAYYFTVGSKRHSRTVFQKAAHLEAKLFDLLFPNPETLSRKFFLRELNEDLINAGLDADQETLKAILNYWAISNAIGKERLNRSTEQYLVRLKEAPEVLRAKIRQREKMGGFCLAIFERDYLAKAKDDPDFTDKKLIEFSTLELQENANQLSGESCTIRDYEYLLLYLHHLNVIELKSGLLVLYNPMKIVRKEENNRKQYTQEDFEQLARFYQSKTEQIHIVGEYAQKQLKQQEEALQFVDDYFVLNYATFLEKYFPKRITKIRQPLTEAQFARIIKDLSTEQLAVINDGKSENILVAAGPGSGKTRVLVHKVASLLLMEDIKAEQFLMLTFSRPAALEFKTRLKDLIGKLAYDVDVFTYHGFAFQLLGRIGNLEKAEKILPLATQAIQNREISMERILCKSVMVVDEFQDVSEKEYQFMAAIAEKAGSIRIIVVGDDDQNIYEFRGASIKYLREFSKRPKAQTYYLTTNYRAKQNLLQFSNRFLATQITAARIKQDIDLVAHQKDNGRIEVIEYQHNHLILPLLDHLQKQKLSGTSCVLTHTNEEAVLIATLLKQKGLPARLIVEREGFELRNLVAIDWFSTEILQGLQDDFGLIPEETWKVKKDIVLSKIQDTHILDIVSRLINSFEATNSVKFKSHWLTYLRDCRIEDLYHPEVAVILVSTMHKAKGKEFDNVFLLLNNYSLGSEEKKRVLYVAITRAKANLFIHTNSVRFLTDGIPALAFREDHQQWPEPATIVLQGGMRDVWLDYFENPHIAYNIKEVHSGQELVHSLKTFGSFMTTDRHEVLRLSKKFASKLQGYLDKGYRLERACAQYLVYWYKDAGEKVRVVLPEIRLSKLE